MEKRDEASKLPLNRWDATRISFTSLMQRLAASDSADYTVKTPTTGDFV
jgi:hypothetical protein